MEATNSQKSSLEEKQRTIVEFLTLSNEKNSANIHKRLAYVYKENVVSIDKVQAWYSLIRGSNNDGKANRKKKEKSSPTLHKTEQPWRRSDVSKEENNQLSPEVVLKKIQGILNKLTEKNFPILLRQIQSFPMETDDYFRKIVKVILLYVCDEHKYSNLYAKLCEHLYYRKVRYQEKNGDSPVYIKFRQVLHDGCIEDLKRRLNDIDSVAYESSYILRYRLKGLNIFMSELYMLQVLPIETFHTDYILPLFDESKLNLYRIEYYCICLNKLGKYLEVQSNKAPAKFNKEHLDFYFKEIDKVMETKPIQLPPRIYYMMKDLVELRQRNWIPRLQEKIKSLFVRRYRFRKFNQSNNKNVSNENKKKTKSEAGNQSNDLEISSSSKTETHPSVIKPKVKDELKEIEWKVRSSMNKMTDMNFITLLEPLLHLPMEPYLPKIVTLIVEKASKEPLFSHLYAELCRHLCCKKKSAVESSATESTQGTTDSSKIEFKELLLEECNRIWMNNINYDGNNQNDINSIKFRLMSKGLAKFITELYKLGIVVNDVIKNYLQTLFDEGKQTTTNVELLSNFLTYIGEDLEKENKEVFENYFSNVKKLYEKVPKYPTRIRFMLLDLLELRENNWLPRVSAQNLEESLGDDMNKLRNKQQLKMNRNRGRTPRGKRQANAKTKTEDVGKQRQEQQQQQQQQRRNGGQRRPGRFIRRNKPKATQPLTPLMWNLNTPNPLDSLNISHLAFVSQVALNNLRRSTNK